MGNALAPVSQAAPLQVQQFGGPLFDPSDPALFNFDISSLNFGNHYGALEMGMLGHMSSGAMEAAANDGSLQAGHPYSAPMESRGYAESHGLPAHVSFGQDGLPPAEWHERSRNGSLQVQTPNNTPNVDHSNGLHDGINGPLAYAIGQGPSSMSSHSPASTDFNSGYENENPMSAATFFTNANQSRPRGSPTSHRPQQENRPTNGPLHPALTHTVRKRQSKFIYDAVKRPYDYVAAYHRLTKVLLKRFSKASENRALIAVRQFRPVLLVNANHIDKDDLIHTEKNLQRSLVTMQESFAEVGTPCLICRRSGEVVGMNKEFEILTGWKRDILLGRSPNLNANTGSSQPRSDDGREHSITPTIPGQEPNNGPFPVNIVELLDEPFAVQYFEDFAALMSDPLGKGHRRVNIRRYLTKDDMARMAERSGSNGKPVKHEPLIKHEDGSIHHGEAMRNLGANGLIDAMIMWHMKRDNFDMPMLVTMQVSLPAPSLSTIN